MKEIAARAQISERGLVHHFRSMISAEAISVGHRLGQLHAGVSVDATAGHLALLAYGVNLRSRAGASAAELNRTLNQTLTALARD